MESREAWIQEPESVPCILCAFPAKRTHYGTHGWKYKCSGRCPQFAVPGYLHYLLELENFFPPESRMKISDYLVNLRLGPDGCYELKKEDINQATGEKIY